MQNRNRTDIVADLELLCQEVGFVYTFCLLVIKHLILTADELDEPKDWRQHLTAKELTFLLGLMVKFPFTLDLTPTLEVFQEQDKRAFDLLGELHRSYVSGSGGRLKDKSSGSEKPTETRGPFQEYYDSPDRIVEPIFYGEDGAYDFQYAEFAEKRYARDRRWLESHLGTSLETILKVPTRLSRLTNSRLRRLQPPESFEEHCQRVLSVYMFTLEDILGQPSESLGCFLEKFACSPGCANQGFSAVGDYNQVLSHPLIRVADGKYFSPIPSNFAQSLYESPFYWMSNDPAYKDRASANSGEAIEEIAHQMLRRVFGKQNTYRNVKVLKGKDVVTDIDVLAICGNKAVIVQAKSKKLTVSSRQGEIERIKADFGEGIQTAYEQGLLCRKAVIEKNNVLRDRRGNTIELHEDLDDAYLVCLSGDHYPAVTTQLHAFLEKSDLDPYPLAVSVFDLDILTFFLKDPFDFLYYLRQRSAHAGSFFADSEMSFLGFHLRSKLYSDDRAEVVWLDSSFAEQVGVNFSMAKGDRPRTKLAEELFSEWRNEDFSELVEALKKTGVPGFTDAIFFLLDLAGAGAENLVKSIRDRKQATQLDGDVHSVTIPIEKSARGISFVCYPPTIDNIWEEFSDFAQATKYKHKADEWLVIGFVAGSAELVDMFFYSREIWQYDQAMERAANVVLKQGTSMRVDRRKVGRNDPCYCGSGVKFKRCHGR